MGCCQTLVGASQLKHAAKAEMCPPERERELGQPSLRGGLSVQERERERERESPILPPLCPAFFPRFARSVKDGAQVRTTPTRSQARNANKKLKYRCAFRLSRERSRGFLFCLHLSEHVRRARVVVSEKVTLSDGDALPSDQRSLPGSARDGFLPPFP